MQDDNHDSDDTRNVRRNVIRPMTAALELLEGERYAEYQDMEDEHDADDDRFLMLQDNDDEDDYLVRDGSATFNLMTMENDDDHDDDNNSENEDDSLMSKKYFAAMSSSPTSKTNKTIRFADSVVFAREYNDQNDDNDHDDDVSLEDDCTTNAMEDSLDLFDTNHQHHHLPYHHHPFSRSPPPRTSTRSIGSHSAVGAGAVMMMMDQKTENSYSHTTDSESEMSEEEDDDGNVVIDKEREQEKEIVKTLLYAGFGFGLMTLAGMGAKKVTSWFSKSSDNNNISNADALNPTDAIDIVQQQQQAFTPPDFGLQDEVQQLTMDSIANASMTSSQGSSVTAGGFYAPAPQGAQYVSIFLLLVSRFVVTVVWCFEPNGDCAILTCFLY
jgi:hypothetical protein